MLLSLYVKDFAIASEVELSLDGGLTAISGETGAGKSLLVDALMLLTGSRADATVVRHGAERAELVALFSLADAPAGRDWLQAQSLLDDEGECNLRRVIRADGGSRAWINGRPATLAQLAELGRHLVEIHGQHEHQALLRRGEQLELLDGFGGHAALRAEVAARHAEWLAVRRRLDALDDRGDPAERLAELERLLVQLDAESLAPVDIEQLLAAHRRQANVAALLTGCEASLARLGGDDDTAVATALAQARHELQRIAAHEPRLAEVLALLDSIDIQLAETVSALERVRDDLDLDPARLDELDARLSRLHELGRRHRVPLERLAERRDALHAELESLRDADGLRERLVAELARGDAGWRKAAAALGQRRRETAQRLGEGVSRLMDALGMAGGQFVAALEANADAAPDPLGGERVEFLVSANPGQPPRPLRKVASGGELSRISLAIEVAALGVDAVPTMVFDEVDSGIGGGVAEVVGRTLRELGRARQVLCVTHHAQVAACGHRHLKVSKSVEDGSTRSRIEALDGDQRVEELARMLGGLEITEATRAHARQMRERGQAE